MKTSPIFFKVLFLFLFFSCCKKDKDPDYVTPCYVYAADVEYNDTKDVTPISSHICSVFSIATEHVYKYPDGKFITIKYGAGVEV